MGVERLETRMFEGKTIHITGASSGLGEVLGRRLLEEAPATSPGPPVQEKPLRPSVTPTGS